VAAVSYGIKIIVKDGIATVTDQTGTIPDGTVNINGKSDDQHVYLGVTVVQPDGMPVVQSSVFGHPYPFKDQANEA
jgi:hypothetical protein